VRATDGEAREGAMSPFIADLKVAVKNA